MAYNLEDGTPSFVIEVDFLKGEKGDTGFSPRIEIASLTSAEYILKVINKDGEFLTPNLKSDLSLADYVLKEEGKGLSTNSFENEEKQKLQELHNYDDTELRSQVSGLAESIGKINSFDIKVVDELPIENIDVHTIYFVPNEQDEKDYYDEFLYVNSRWEHIGTSKVDLSNYATLQQIEELRQGQEELNQAQQELIDDLGKEIDEAKEVAVSDVTPEDRRKVWIKKGKNLAKINSFSAVNTYTGVQTVRVKVNPNSSIVISATKNRIAGVGMTNHLLYGIAYLKQYNKDNQLIKEEAGGTYSLPSGSWSFEWALTTLENCEYIVIDFSNNNGDGNLNTSVTNIQVEYGTQKTEFEPYIDRTISVLNEHDKYEEVYNENDNMNIYSTEEQVVGTWIDGKPLYRKVVNFGLLGNTSADVEFTVTCDAINIIEYNTYLQSPANSGTSSLPINNGTHFCYPNMYSLPEGKLIAHIHRDVEGSWRDHYLYAIITYTKTTD